MDRGGGIKAGIPSESESRPNLVDVFFVRVVSFLNTDSIMTERKGTKMAIRHLRNRYLSQ